MNDVPMPPAPASGGRMRPVGVSIISVLYFIGAGLIILAGLLGSSVLNAFVGGSAANIGSAVLWIIILVIVAIQVIIGWGLWNGKNWARIVAIVFAALAILFALPTLLRGGLVTVAIQGVYLWYLGFSSSAKEYFG